MTSAQLPDTPFLKNKERYDLLRSETYTPPSVLIGAGAGVLLYGALTLAGFNIGAALLAILAEGGFFVPFFVFLLIVEFNDNAKKKKKNKKKTSRISLRTYLRDRKLARKYLEYAAYIGDAQSFEIEYLSKIAGERVTDTIANIRAMQEAELLDGWMFDRGVVYLTRGAKRRKDPVLRLSDLEQQERVPEASDHYEDALEYVQRIRLYNDILPDKGISDALDETEETLKTILGEVKRNPAQDKRLRRIVNYYLPLLMRHLETYKDLYENKKDYRQADEIRQQIIGGVTMLNKALHTLMVDMMQPTAMDISSDLRVMETMLKQDGLLTDDFRQE